MGDALDVRVTCSVADVLADPGVEAVVVATPARTHRDLVAACLDNDRHVLVEKPLACSVDDATVLADSARARGLVVMCDQTYRFAPAVQVVRELIADDASGRFRFADSIRTNHHHGQPDVGVLWDLAHHDVSILSYVLPTPVRPIAVSAMSADVLGIGRAHAGSLTLHFPDGSEACVKVDWWAEQKARTMRFGVGDGVLTWDDLDSSGPRLELRAGNTARRIPIGDDREPLALVVDEFLASIAEGRAPSCGPAEEITVLRILEAATRSSDAGGAPVLITETAADPLEART